LVRFCAQLSAFSFVNITLVRFLALSMYDTTSPVIIWV
jgi:hypothetical protein